MAQITNVDVLRSGIYGDDPIYSWQCVRCGGLEQIDITELLANPYKRLSPALTFVHQHVLDYWREPPVVLDFYDD